MFPGSQHYPEGRFAPMRGAGCNWHVWCATGALIVLQGQEFMRKLTEEPETQYVVNFGNGAAAHIAPEHPLWDELMSITKSFKVEVFMLTLWGHYIPWTGGTESLRSFDAIRISNKECSLS